MRASQLFPSRSVQESGVFHYNRVFHESRPTCHAALSSSKSPLQDVSNAENVSIFVSFFLAQLSLSLPFSPCLLPYGSLRAPSVFRGRPPPAAPRLETTLQDEPRHGETMSRYLLAAGLLAAFLYFMTRPDAVAPGLSTAGVRGALSSATTKQPKTPGMLPIEDAKHSCQTRRWEPYPERDKKRKV